MRTSCVCLLNYTVDKFKDRFSTFMLIFFQIRIVVDPLPSSLMIRLNVGGKKFITTMNTLQSFPESTLAKMFSSHQLPEKDLTGAYFIDSSPMMFGYVLDWCKHRKLIVGNCIDLEGLEVVADSFGLLEMKREVALKKKKRITKKFK